jgi:superfamily II DNA/RNA helicase
MGRKGKALTFLTKRDLPHLRKLIRKLKIKPLWIGKDPLGDDALPKDGKPKKKKRNYRHSRNRRQKSRKTQGVTSPKNTSDHVAG